MGRAAAPVRSVPRPGRPQEHQIHRGRRDRPRTGRVLVGRDGGLTPPPPQGCAPSLLIGRGGEHHLDDAPGAAAAGPIPGGTMPRPSRSETSQGTFLRLPTCGPNPRISVWRQPIHCVPARRATPRAARSPPPAREVNPYACSCASACKPRCGSTMPSTRGTIALMALLHISAVSDNVRPLHDAAEALVAGVPVAPGQVAADHAGLLAV